MNNFEDQNRYSSESLSQQNDELEDTVPPTPIPVELRAGREKTAWNQGDELDDTVPPTPVPAELHAGRENMTWNQDEISTPPPLAPLADQGGREPQRTRASTAMKIVVGLCLVLSLLSLALSGFLIYSLSGVQQTAVEGLDTAISALDNFGGKGFQYEYRFERTIPVSASIPIQQDIVFPFEGNFPINTTVEVPINAGILGTYVVEVPIDTSVYVNTEIPISVDQTFNISTSIPVSMTIPIDIQPDDPAIQDLLSRVREWLVRIRDSFGVVVTLPSGASQ